MVKVVLDQETNVNVGVQHSASKLLGMSRFKSKKGGEESEGSLNPHRKNKNEKSRKGTLTRNTSRFFNAMSQRSQNLPRHFSVLDLQAEEISELLTKEDSRLFTNVSVDEFSAKAWTPALDSGIGVMTHRWNKLGRWVASEIVNNANLKQRVEILKVISPLSLSLSLSIYIYTYIYIGIYLNLSLSIYLSIYLYIYALYHSPSVKVCSPSSYFASASST